MYGFISGVGRVEQSTVSEKGIFFLFFFLSGEENGVEDFVRKIWVLDKIWMESGRD